MYTDEVLKEICEHFKITFKETLSHIFLSGSPDRTVFRVVIEDDKGNPYILEQVPPKTLDLKNKISKSLTYLNNQGLQGINCYLQDDSREYVYQHETGLWQIEPFVNGVFLKRPYYLLDTWRGGVLADFLIDFREKSCEIPYFEKDDVFQIDSYVYDIMTSIQANKPELVPKFEPALKFIEKNLFPHLKGLPTAFCHGDYHVVNVIWGEDRINAVIDWEFLGYKPEFYDFVNLMGCVGIEDPDGLVGELSREFVRKLKEKEFLSQISWEYVVEYIIAQRFAWVSEWLRKKDTQMQELEEVYINLLIDKRDVIKKTWASL